MKTIYSDIEIEYDEAENEWVFTLRGRERRVASLAKAKEAIDKPPPPKKAKAFERFKAYSRGWGQRFQIVEVTSIAANTRSWRQRDEVWVVDDRGNHEKRDASDVYPVNEHNDAAIKALNDLESQARALKEKFREVETTLQPYKIEPE